MAASTVTGVQTALRGMRALRVRTSRNIAEGLEKCGLLILEESQRLVPVASGLLKGSGTVVSTGVGFGARTIISYTTGYAIFVHEDLSKYHAPPTQAKYLAQAVVNMRRRCSIIMQRQMEAKTGEVRR